MVYIVHVVLCSPGFAAKSALMADAYGVGL